MNMLTEHARRHAKELREQAALLEEAADSRWVYEQVEGIALELRRRFPEWCPNTIQPRWSVHMEDVSVGIAGFGSVEVDYESLLQCRGARLSYDTRHMVYEFKERLLFSNVTVECTFSAKVPEGDREFLREMNKIVEEVGRSERAVC